MIGDCDAVLSMLPQKEALALVEELAGSDELRMDYDLEPGAPSSAQHKARMDALQLLLLVRRTIWSLEQVAGTAAAERPAKYSHDAAARLSVAARHGAALASC